jgi:hypothetical protein
MSAGSGADELRVDVVVNNYEYGRFLAAAVDSALAQTHPGTTVIVVDDGSSDESREVLRRYEGRVELVLKENGGQASALNAGGERCRGDAVIFLDADDVLHPQAAARCAAALAANPAASRAQMWMEVIDREGVPTGERKPTPRLPTPSGDLRRAELRYPFDLAWLPGGAYAYRWSALRQIWPLPEGDVVGADWYLIHLTALLGEVVTVEEVCCSYRVHGGNNYEQLQGSEVDLERVRSTIRYAAATSAALLALAARLGLPHPARILSVADLGQRLISLRLDPAGHPLPGDSRLGLLGDAVGAVRRRDNVSPALRLAFLAWFAAMAAAPRPLGRRLAAWFIFPEQRVGLNGLLGRLQRGGAG